MLIVLKMKKKIILTDTARAFNTIQHPFMIILNALEILSTW